MVLVLFLLCRLNALSCLSGGCRCYTRYKQHTKKCRSGLKGVKHTHERPVLGGVLVIEAFAFFFVYFSLAVLGEKR